MGTIDQKMSDYVWDNLDELKSVFSEKIYRVLLRFREKGDREGFSSALELLDDELLKEIKNQSEDIDNMSIEEIATAMKVTDYDNFIDKKKYIDRAEYLVKNYKEDDENYALLFNNLAELYKANGEYKKARPLLLKALKIWKEVWGEEHLNTATCYNNLANLYRFMGNYDEAESLFFKSLEINKKLFGEEHINIAKAYNNLAGLYKLIGDYENAKLLYIKSLNIQKNIPEEEHLVTSSFYNNLADLYRILNDYDKAYPLYIKTLEINEKILGEKHPTTIIVYNNLALLYEAMGNYKKAESLYDKVLKRIEEIWEKEHPYRIAFYENLDSFIQKSNFQFQINQIKIENFKQFKAPFSMQFSKQINIIIGQNAIGKTTLLQAITLGLLKENSPDEETSYTKYITKGKDKSEIEVTYQDDKKRKVTIFKNRREIKEKYNRPFVLAYGSNFFTDYIESDPIVQEMLNETIESDFAHTIFLEHTNKFWNPLSILRNLAISKHKKAKEKKETMLKVLNLFLEEEKYALVPDSQDDARFHFVKKDDNSPLDLGQLSEGYRGNVLLITDMLIKILGTGREPSTVNAVVLIDEFDRHLHPKWQSKLVDKLTTVFKNIQFIMTTHNPMSILDRDAEEITIIEEIEGKVEAVKEIGTKNIDVGMVLLKYFDVPIVGNTMRDNLNEITKIKLKGRRGLTKEDKERIKEIEEALKYTPATDFIYNRAYFNFLVFLKENKNIDFEDYQNLKDKDMLKLMEEYKELF